MLKKIRHLLLGVLLLGGGYLYAMDTQLDLTMSATTFNGGVTSDWYFSGVSYARLTFQNTNQDFIKAVFSMESYVSDQVAAIGIYQAFVRFMTQDQIFRFTMGKAPISWGEGIFYNAGDVLFPSTNPVLDFTSFVVRDNTRWVMVPYISLGESGFIELLLASPHLSLLDTVIFDYVQGFLPQDLSKLTWTHISGGGRVSWKLWDVQWQLGALYIGETAWTRPFLALSGGIAQTVDWYVASRVEVGEDIIQNELWQKTWDITAGLSLPWVFADNSSLSFRLEGIFRPFGAWSEQEFAQDEFLEAHDLWGAKIFFEMGYSPNSIFSMVFRTIYSAVANSAFLNLVFEYAPYQDLTLGLNAVVQLGDNPLKIPSGLLFGISLRYVWD